MQFVHQKLFQVGKYVTHSLVSGNQRSLHIPFVIDFYKRAIKEGSWKSEEWSKIELIRGSLLKNTTFIEILDFGAKGSPEGMIKSKRIADIAKNAGSSPKKGRLLSRIANYLQPKNILELGTSLGLGTLYLHTGAPNAFVSTFEGSPSTAKLATVNFQSFSSFSYKVLHGEISASLQEYLLSADINDLYFIDANHQYQATLNYYNVIKNHGNKDVCIVFDDIYWSKDMCRAWKELISKEEVMLSLDLFWVGIVFLGDKQPKQHFVLKV